MKTCPTCGSEVKELWKEHWCHCGCGICCRASDPGADKSIEAWKAKCDTLLKEFNQELDEMVKRLA